jgi:uncharacterized protein (TIGR00369 family)
MNISFLGNKYMQYFLQNVKHRTPILGGWSGRFERRKRVAAETSRALQEPGRSMRVVNSATGDVSSDQGGPMSHNSAGKTYGTVSPDRQKEMSGLEFVQSLVDGTLPLNTIAETLGYEIAEVERGRVIVTATPNGTHLNPSGTVHGGLAATLLDSAMGLAIRSTLEKGVGATTLEFKISLVRPITPETGLIRAEGTVLSCGRRIGTAEGRITDTQGRLLAHGTTTCLIFGS